MRPRKGLDGKMRLLTHVMEFSTSYNVADLILPVQISFQAKIKEELPATEIFL